MGGRVIVAAKWPRLRLDVVVKVPRSGLILATQEAVWNTRAK